MGTKEHIIVLPGLNCKEHAFKKLIGSLSDRFDVLYFAYDYDSTLAEVAESLDSFLTQHMIQRAHFIAYSMGAALLRIFYARNRNAVGTVVQIAPLNRGSRVLAAGVCKVPFMTNIFGKIMRDYVKNMDEIWKLPLPPRVGIIAGTKRFCWHRLESFLIPLFCWNPQSDGKVFIAEALVPGIPSVLVHEYHADLVRNPAVIEQTYEFLRHRKFKPKHF